MKIVIHANEAERGEGADSVVPWWSFTKTLIAALALTLVRGGRIALDDPVPDTGSSLRELLLHRAGLADYGALPAYHAAVAADEDAWTAEHLLAQVAPLHAKVTRGAFCYSNVGYLLVRRHLEHATGLSLGDALQERVFVPLGVAGPRIAGRRGDLDGVKMGPAMSYDPRWVYHGLVVGTLRDAALLLHRLMMSDLLPPHLRVEMCTGLPVGDPGVDRPWQSAAYGLGVMTGVARTGLRAAGHTGGGPGSGVGVYYFPEKAATAAVFIAGDSGAAAEREAFALGAEF